MDPAQRIGSLVINPGGPGEAGTRLLGRDLGVLAPAVKQRFDVIEMDPRGGQQRRHQLQSRARRGPPARTPARRWTRSPSRPPNAARSSTPTGATRDACAQAAGPLLGFIGTTDVARDLEQLRKAVGDEKLTFLGMSYGTLLGATYADLFPTHLRALVLDGVIDPSLPSFELWMAQAVGFQQQLDAFFASCGSGCAWRPGIALPDALDRLTQRLRTQPLAVGGATVGVSELYSALFSRLYSPSRWSSLAAALAAANAVTADRSCRSRAATSARRRRSTINSDASSAINCLDHPVDPNPDSYPALATQADGAFTGVRSVPRVGRPPVRDVGSRTDPTAASRARTRRAARPRDRYDERPGNALRVGAERRVDVRRRECCSPGAAPGTSRCSRARACAA